MNTLRELDKDEILEIEGEISSDTLDEINDDLEDILASLEDLSEKITQYCSSHPEEKSIFPVLKKIEEFCELSAQYHGVLEDYL